VREEDYTHEELTDPGCTMSDEKEKEKSM